MNASLATSPAQHAVDRARRVHGAGTEASARIWPGWSHPLGATWDGQGTNFSVFSEVAERVELCLFDDDDRETRIDLGEVTGYAWHGYLPGIRPGQRYGFRVHGPWDPAAGHRSDARKLLLDPCARAIDGHPRWNPALFPGSHEDSAPFMPRAVVIDPSFDWGNDRPPRVPRHETIIYECHVKGFSRRHPGIPPELAGTFAALAHPAAIDHLTRLGATSVELMPVHEFVHDQHLLERGRRNYWGYNSIGYFAPHHEYSAAGARGGQVGEFKRMVAALHAAGIEVILDVVYNHTAEGNHLGPILSLKGLDNAAYYRLVPDHRQYYMDYTGTGNTLNVRHPQVLQLIMDSLRYWILEMHVDGFRFDLAAALARELHDVDMLSSFLQIIHQDPVVSQVKLIAEPWDVGEGGYQVGRFPPRWLEWNGRYRDLVRDFWRGEEHTLGEFASRITGSSDLYETTGRKPYASVNFVTSHDGFTLDDLVSYNHKHNEANGEENRDGENHNHSWNSGEEGWSDDPAVIAIRERQKRNFMATLFLSQGIPMLLSGDEIGRSQHGNNNAYCQDNDLSWLDWDHGDGRLLAFTRRVIRLRRQNPVFQRRGWFQGQPIHGAGVRDIAWFGPGGTRMRESQWQRPLASAVAVFLNGEGLRHPGPRGEPVVGDSFYLIFNAHWEGIAFRLPGTRWGRAWRLELNTDEWETADGIVVRAGQIIGVEARSILAFRRAW